MTYSSSLEQSVLSDFDRWQEERWLRERPERTLHPDQRFDEVGWDNYFFAVVNGMKPAGAASLAMDGTYRQRLRVREQLADSFRRHREFLWRQLGVDVDALVDDSTAPDQLQFWSGRLAEPSYVYFIQAGRRGPVKIGLAIDPERRIRQLRPAITGG